VERVVGDVDVELRAGFIAFETDDSVIVGDVRVALVPGEIKVCGSGWIFPVPNEGNRSEIRHASPLGAFMGGLTPWNDHDRNQSPGSYRSEVGEPPWKNICISSSVTFPSLLASIALKILAWAVWNSSSDRVPSPSVSIRANMTRMHMP